MTETEGTRSEVRETLDSEITEQQRAADAEPDPTIRTRRQESAAIRAEIADEEAAAVSAEIAENKETALSLRVPQSLSHSLKQRAAAEGLPVSALVRRILTQAVEHPDTPVATVEQVEQIARRAAREEVYHYRNTA